MKNYNETLESKPIPEKLIKDLNPMGTTDRMVKNINKEIIKMMGVIESKLPEPEKTDWSYVGDLQHVRTILKNIIDFME